MYLFVWLRAACPSLMDYGHFPLLLLLLSSVAPKALPFLLS